MASAGTDRRAFLRDAFATLGAGVAAGTAASAARQAQPAPPADRVAALPGKLRITRLETFLVQPRWLFLKIHTDEGVVGLGEPVVEGRALTVQTAIKEIEPYLIGKDPRHVVHHWQAIYRHAFYRGGPVLTSALSGIDQALWDIKGKLLNAPIYELFGGPTRTRVRVYAHARTIDAVKQRRAEGFTAFKTGPLHARPPRFVESVAFVRKAEEHFASLREAIGPDADIGIDFHGAISPATAKLLIKAIEPYQPMFVEEPVASQNVQALADIARGTHLPIATGARLFTKWDFRQVLEQQAAIILQPDLSHAGGITEVRLIAGMAEAYYAAIAPHNPLGPISLAAGLQLAASIPNFLCQEQVSLGEGYLKRPFVVRDGYVDIPIGPGLGIELDDDQLQSKIGHNWRNREEFDQDDGSVLDW